MKWESIRTWQTHEDFVPSRLWAPSHLLLKCFPSWTCFSAFKNIYLWKEARLEDVCVPHVPKVLSCFQHWVQRTLTEGKCCRERCEDWHQEKTRAWAGSPAGVQSREKCTSLNWGLQLAGEPAAQPSQHLHSLLSMPLASQGQTTWPFTASPPSHTTSQTFARQTPEVCYLFLPDKDSSFTKHMVISLQLYFLHKSLGSELLWLCCSFSR